MSRSTKFYDGTPIRRGDIKRVMYAVMPNAYAEAAEVSGDALAQTMMYAARQLGAGHLGLPADVVDGKYFTQRLLRDYLVENPEESADWSISWDDRGSVYGPYTQREVKLGTRPARENVEMVDGRGRTAWFDFDRFSFDLPSDGRGFRAILMVAKAGLADELVVADIPNRFSVAIASTRRQSTTGALQLIEWLGWKFPDVPILVAHDFDVAGMLVVPTGREQARAYGVEPVVVDIGLRLEDVGRAVFDPVGFDIDPVSTLRRSGATPDEISFLRETASTGRRVELNTQVGRSLLWWIEARLRQHGFTDEDPT